MSDPRRDKTEDTAETKPYVVTEQVGHLLRRAYQRHLAIFQAHADDLNVTSVQFVTLCAINDLGPCAQKDLVEATAIDQATIRGILERLRCRGLIDVSRDASDGRKVVMTIRDEGKALLQTMYPRGHQITRQTLDPLNPAEQLALLYLLQKMSGQDPDRIVTGEVD